MKTIINTTDAPAPIGPYSQAVSANGFLYVSGQIPINPATGELTQDSV
ncbi:MAG: Rid family hydrolase, partial [Pedobacter sp.]|nr:Rid family hydrolase [Pedobacter sp.]